MNAVASQLVSAAVCMMVAGTSAGGAQTHGSAKAPASAQVSLCKASDLSLGTDAENGSFNGMSHGGTLLVLRNLSAAPCRVPLRPTITFMDGAKPLDVKLSIPGSRFMHPGPVLVPVVVAPGAEVTSKLRWVSGEVYSHSVCVSPTAIAVKISDDTQQTAMAAHLCGETATGLSFEATPFAVDPTFPERTQPAR